MATDLQDELRRAKNVVVRLSAEIGGINKKFKDNERKLDDLSMSLTRVTKERDCLNQAYNEEKRKMQWPLYENGRWRRVLEIQRNQIKQQAKEIKKRDARLVSKSKQLLVLRELHMVHKARKVPVEKVTKEDDEISIELIDECGNVDIKGSGGAECNSFQDMFPPIPPPESLVDSCNDMPNNSLDLSGVLPVPDDEIAESEWLSTFFENSSVAGGITLDIDFSDDDNEDDSSQTCTLNPVSDLKSSSSCSGGKTMPLIPDPVVPGRAQRKRPRSPILNQQPPADLISLKSGIIDVQNLPTPSS